MEAAQALLDRSDRSRAAKRLAAVIASACALFATGSARALSTQFVLNPSLSLVAMGGDFANYPSNSALSLDLDFDHVVDGRVPVTFDDFFLPTVPIAWGGRDVFGVPSAVAGTLDVGTGAMNLGPVTVQLRQQIPYTIPPTSSFSFRFTTGTVTSSACGLFPGGPLASGTAFTLDPGGGTLIGAACVTSTDPDTLFGVRLVGVFSPGVIATPEPRTLVLVGSCVLGFACVYRRQLFHDTSSVSRPLVRSE